MHRLSTQIEISLAIGSLHLTGLITDSAGNYGCDYCDYTNNCNDGSNELYSTGYTMWNLCFTHSLLRCTLLLPC